ncbi:MAG: pyrroline-5-carboxylate reductase [Deltaproteobacteria bacterium]
MPLGKRLGIVGCGNMGEALLKGWLASGVASPDELWASAPHQLRLDELRGLYGIHVERDNRAVARAADVVLLAVKPQILEGVLEEVAPQIEVGKLAISIAAGVPVRLLERRLRPPARVVRAMPNVASLVGAGATGIAAGGHATEADMLLAEELFRAVGRTAVVEENLMDAVTGLSGSGPAYIFLIIEALSDAGVKVGLSRHIAQDLAAQTVLGAAKLLIDTKMHPGQLKDMVTSPGGTAIAGLHTLEAGGLRTTLMDAVEAATRRARELGGERLRADPTKG